MNDDDRKEPKSETEAGPPESNPQNAGLTPQDEEILLKRLRELGYVE
jgi:hypothetical protein